MTRPLVFLLAAGATTAALAATAAQLPLALAQAQPGLWEINGAPGAATPVRQCLADVALLGRFEHRSSSCSAKTLKDAGTIAQIEYSCGGAGFGHSEVTALTPRSLRISTQGISDGAPFNYVIQAHRLGDCPLPARH